jgi:hypothetical protein
VQLVVVVVVAVAAAAAAAAAAGVVATIVVVVATTTIVVVVVVVVVVVGPMAAVATMEVVAKLSSAHDCNHPLEQGRAHASQAVGNKRPGQGGIPAELRVIHSR